MQNIIVIRHGQPQTLSPDEAARFNFAAGDEVFIRTDNGATPAQLRVQGDDLILSTANGDIALPHLAPLLTDAQTQLYINSIPATENTELSAHLSGAESYPATVPYTAEAEAEATTEADKTISSAIQQIETEPTASGGPGQFAGLDAGAAVTGGTLSQAGLGSQSMPSVTSTFAASGAIAAGNTGDFNSAPVFSVGSGQSVATASTTTTTATTPTTDITPPEAPTLSVSDNVGSVTGMLGLNGYTDDTQPTFSGNAEAGSIVKVFDGVTQIGSTITDGSGHWQLSHSLGEGNHSIVATATDAAGNISAESEIFSFAIDTTPPAAPTITGAIDDVTGITGPITSDALTNDAQPTFSGNAEAGSTVNFYDGSTLLGNTLTDANGHWSFTPGTPLADGSHSISATATDVVGNTSAAASDVFTFSIDTVTPDINLSPGVFQYQTLYGQVAEAGATISLYDNGNLVSSVQDLGDSSHTFSFGSPSFTDGLHRLTFDVNDAVGNMAISTTELVINVENGVWSQAVLPTWNDPNLGMYTAFFDMLYTAPFNDPDGNASFQGTIGNVDTLLFINTDIDGNPSTTPATLDFTKFSDFEGGERIQSVEHYDLTGTADNTIILTVNDVLASDIDLFNYVTGLDGLETTVNAHQLMIDGNAGDSIVLADAESWQSAGTTTYHHGQSYAVYNSTTQDSNGVTAQLLVNTQVTVVLEDQPHAAAASLPAG